MKNLVVLEVTEITMVIATEVVKVRIMALKAQTLVQAILAGISSLSTMAIILIEL